MRLNRATDWDSYHLRPYWTARLTRFFTARALLAAIRRHAPARPPGGLVMAELGGANSCFYARLMRALGPREYHVIDNNAAGLDLLWQKRCPQGATIIHQADILQGGLELRADVVFSVGLIEHFSPPDTARAIAAHFDLVAPQGLVVMTFPTPTGLYWTVRRLSEALGLWIFHDERPLALEEVRGALRGLGRPMQTSLLWPTILTQTLIAARPLAGPTTG